MTAYFSRLVWALPLVICVGMLLIYLLRRLGVGMAVRTTASTPVLCSTTPLSPHTRAMVVEFEAKRYLVIESDVSVSLLGLTPDKKDNTLIPSYWRQS